MTLEVLNVLLGFEALASYRPVLSSYRFTVFVLLLNNCLDTQISNVSFLRRSISFGSTRSNQNDLAGRMGSFLYILFGILAQHWGSHLRLRDYCIRERAVISISARVMVPMRICIFSWSSFFRSIDQDLYIGFIVLVERKGRLLNSLCTVSLRVNSLLAQARVGAVIRVTYFVVAAHIIFFQTWISSAIRNPEQLICCLNHIRTKTTSFHDCLFTFL